MLWAISTLVALAPFAVWGFRVYLARAQQAAVEAERKAGSDASQVEANNAENDRINRAADAGNAAGGVRDNTPDPYNRDK